MNPENLKVLAERASNVEGRPTERLDEVHARIAQTRRRRQVGVVTAAVVAVVLALTAGIGVLALTDTEHTPPAKPAPIPTPKPPGDEKPVARKVTYAKGQTIHWGDRAIDVGSEVPQLTATDDGVVFIRAGGEEPDNCNGPQGCFGALWFTDGSEVVRIGSVSGSWVRGYQIQFSTAGSMVVWFEPDPDARPLNRAGDVGGEYVVYDTHERREVARMGSEGRDPDRDGHVHLQIEAVFNDYVYWTPDDRAKPWCLDFAKYYGACRRHGRIMRLDTATGTQMEIQWATYISDRRSRPRLIFGPTDKFDAPYRPFPSNQPGAETITFGRQGDRLVAEDTGGGVVTARVTMTGEPVRLRLAAGYPEVDDFFMVAWLDDHRVVLQADNDNSLLVCPLPRGRCRTTVAGPLLADFGGRG